MAVILWTSTRNDMRPEHWCPNHFVPVLWTEISMDKIPATISWTGSDDMSEKTGESENVCEIATTEVVDGKCEK